MDIIDRSAIADGRYAIDALWAEWHGPRRARRGARTPVCVCALDDGTRVEAEIRQNRAGVGRWHLQVEAGRVYPPRDVLARLGFRMAHRLPSEGSHDVQFGLCGPHVGHRTEDADCNDGLLLDLAGGRVKFIPPEAPALLDGRPVRRVQEAETLGVLPLLLTRFDLAAGLLWGVRSLPQAQIEVDLRGYATARDATRAARYAWSLLLGLEQGPVDYEALRP